MSDGQWVGCVLLLAAIALALYGAWEWRYRSVLVDEDERPIPTSDTPIADEAWEAVHDGRGTE